MSGSKGKYSNLPQKTRVIRICGSTLIILGVLILGYAGVQKAIVRHYQEELKKAYEDSFYEIPDAENYRRVILTEWQPARLQIPKLGVDLMVLEGDVFDDELLNKGPVHFANVVDKTTGAVLIEGDLPGTEPGNVAIAGHRGARWGFFTDLDRLAEGDELYLDTAGYRFTYLVEWVRIVDPYDWGVIESTDYPALTLQTCEPKTGAPTHRLIVRSALKEVSRAPQP
ncbi:MAG: class E sortase [Bacillota bacterium]